MAKAIFVTMEQLEAQSHRARKAEATIKEIGVLVAEYRKRLDENYVLAPAARYVEGLVSEAEAILRGDA